MLAPIAFILFLFFYIAPGPGHAGDKVGVVLLHGKESTSRTMSPIGKLAASLRKTGFIVSTPDMPWSRSRYLAKDYEGSMNEIDKAVAQLRKKGANKIVVGGHSMGGNAALGYGASREGLAGIMVIAPGHTPSHGHFQNAVNIDYRRAKELVDAGRGSAKATFLDINQGKRQNIKVRADIYLSWFDREGPASMPTNARNLKPGTALLWAVGKKDRMWLSGETFAYSLAPENPNSLYLEVPGGHMETPTVAARQISAWLKGL